MAGSQSSLKNRSIAVVGFNARPIACSALKAGARVYVSDYWGDSDLAACCDRWTSVLQPKPGSRQREKLEKPMHVSLVDNMIELVESLDIDYALVGSGFDDHPEDLERLGKHIGIRGNTLESFRKARNMKLLRKMAIRHGIHFPTRHEFDDYDSAIRGCRKIGYPCVIRPKTSGGGAGIVLVREEDDVGGYFHRRNEKSTEGVVQQYIRGLDLSCSVLSTGSDAIAISCQGQLIGIPSAGRNCDFAFCGNYHPLQISASSIGFAMDASARICADMALVGSNGVDMIIDTWGKLWILEVNPRFQGTLELLERSGNISVTTLHHESCDGRLPATSPSFSPAVKMIVYSHRNGTVPDLSRYENAADRTPAGVHVNRGDPICSVMSTGPSLKECYSRSCTIALKIQSETVG